MNKIKLVHKNGKFLRVETESFKEALSYQLDCVKERYIELKIPNEYKKFEKKVKDLNILNFKDQILANSAVGAESTCSIFEQDQYAELLTNSKKFIDAVPQLSSLFKDLEPLIDYSILSQEAIKTPYVSIYGGQSANEQLYFALHRGDIFRLSELKKFLNIQKNLSIIELDIKKNINGTKTFTIFCSDSEKEGFPLASYHPKSTQGFGPLSKAKMFSSKKEAFEFAELYFLNFQILEVSYLINKVVHTTGKLDHDANQYLIAKEIDELSTPVMKEQIRVYKALLEKHNIPLPDIKKKFVL